MGPIVCHGQCELVPHCVTVDSVGEQSPLTRPHPRSHTPEEGKVKENMLLLNDNC